jgi:hypothetical protein
MKQSPHSSSSPSASSCCAICSSASSSPSSSRARVRRAQSSSSPPAASHSCAGVLGASHRLAVGRLQLPAPGSLEHADGADDEPGLRLRHDVAVADGGERHDGPVHGERVALVRRGRDRRRRGGEELPPPTDASFSIFAPVISTGARAPPSASGGRSTVSLKRRDISYESPRSTLQEGAQQRRARENRRRAAGKWGG